MVKGISAINGIGRKAIMGAVLAGSMFLCASSPIKNVNKDKEPQKTELMSKESAEALKVNLSSQISDKVPVKHNERLDNTILALIPGEENKANARESLNSLYNEYGTYLASVIIQTNIDGIVFQAYLNGDAEILKNVRYGNARYESATSSSSDLQAAKNVKDKVMEWFAPNYQKIFNPVIESFDHKPDYDELLTAINSYVIKNEYNFFGGNNLEKYTAIHKEFISLQKNDEMTELEKQSDAIAHMVHIADWMLFDKLLRINGLDVYGDKKNEKAWYTFYAFRQAAEPKTM